MRCNPVEGSANVETKLRCAWLMAGVASGVTPATNGACVWLNGGGKPRNRQPSDAADGDEGELEAGVADGERARNENEQRRESGGVQEVETAIEEPREDD